MGFVFGQIRTLKVWDIYMEIDPFTCTDDFFTRDNRIMDGLQTEPSGKRL